MQGVWQGVPQAEQRGGPRAHAPRAPAVQLQALRQIVHSELEQGPALAEQCLHAPPRASEIQSELQVEDSALGRLI